MLSLLHLLAALPLLLGALPPLSWLLRWWWRSRGEVARLPPAPPGWRPVLGHLHLLGALPHQALGELARRHGLPLMSLWLGSVPTIVASTPDAAQIILKTHDRTFASRPCTAMSIHLGFQRSGIVTGPSSEHWRRMRKICNTDLLSPKRVHSFQPIRREDVNALLRAVFAGRGQVMEVRSKLCVSALDGVSRMTVGQRLCELCSHAPELIDEIMHLAGAFNLGDFIPFLAPLDLQGYEKRMKKAAKEWSSILDNVIAQRRSDKSHQSNDFLDVLLLATPKLTDNTIRAVVSDMFLGGSETSTVAIEWALAELLANPSAMMTLQEELDSVVGKERLVEEEDLPSLPFLNAIVKETMRLHPVGPLLVPHESLARCEIYEYSIPPKTRVLINAWAIGRDPNAWDKPEQFQPERFLQGGKYNHVGVHGQHFQLLPFGSGRRICPGLTLGLLNVHFVLASLVQAFDWKLPNSIQQLDLTTERFALSLAMASPLSIIPSQKLKPSMYHKTLF